MSRTVSAWYQQVRFLVLPDEAKVLQQLKDAEDLGTFQGIFWARRDEQMRPGDGAFKSAVDAKLREADARFSESGKKGSETGCGQLHLLLGPADEVTGTNFRTRFDEKAAREQEKRREDAWNPSKTGARRPETWVYKSTPDRTFRLPGGDLRVELDDGCEFPEGARTMEELARMAARAVVHPEIAYEFLPTGRLRPFTPAAAPTPPAIALLDDPRADFRVAFEPTLQMPGQGGGYSAGLLRVEPATGGAAPAAPIVLDIAARLSPESGARTDVAPRRVAARARPDGSLVSSYGFLAPPGRYTVRLAVVEPTSGRGTTVEFAIDVPDYASGRLVVSPLMVLGGDDAPPADASADPYSALKVGAERLAPRPGNVLSVADTLRLMALIHNASTAPDTRRAALRATFTVLKDGKLVAKGKEQTFDTVGAAASVGPIPLSAFAPGAYLARLEVSDEVAKTVVVRESPFEVTK